MRQTPITETIQQRANCDLSTPFAIKIFIFYCAKKGSHETIDNSAIVLTLGADTTIKPTDADAKTWIAKQRAAKLEEMKRIQQELTVLGHMSLADAKKKMLDDDETSAATSQSSDQQGSFAKVIHDHKMANGMTVQQANQALTIKFHKLGESSDGEVWVASVSKQEPIKSIGGRIAGGQITGTKYTLEVQNGVITHWDSTPFSADPGQGAVSN